MQALIVAVAGAFALAIFSGAGFLAYHKPKEYALIGSVVWLTVMVVGVVTCMYEIGAISGAAGALADAIREHPDWKVSELAWAPAGITGAQILLRRWFVAMIVVSALHWALATFLPWARKVAAEDETVDAEEASDIPSD